MTRTGLLFCVLSGALALSAPPADVHASSPAAPSFAAPADSSALLDELRQRIRHDRSDLEARRELSDLLGTSDDVELRREAMRALREALLIDEQDADLWIRVARLQERRGFRREARRAYHRALEMAPERADLWDELAHHELHRFQRYDRREFIERSSEANRRALERDRRHPSAMRRAVRLACLNNDWDAVDSLTVVWLQAHPESPWPWMVRGMRLADNEAWKRAGEAFAEGIARMTPLERQPFHSLDLVDPKEEELRAAAPDTAHAFESFWRWRDPTPADRDNPRLMEHYRRMVLAEMLFALDALDVHGWEHAPGEMIVRYGVDDEWTYEHSVRRGEDYRASALVGLPTLEVHYGEKVDPIHFQFVDYNLSGRFFNPIEGTPSDLDYLLVTTPEMYVDPFAAPAAGQEVELWRFVDAAGRGRIEVAVALDPGEWPEKVFEEPYRLATKLTRYDPSWQVADAAVGSWAGFETDAFGRLVGLFEFEGTADSVIVGLETADRLETARAAGYATLSPRPPDELLLSSIAFLSQVQFERTGSYPRAYGSGLPNPGHRYYPGDPVEFGFEAYQLATDASGNNRARLSVTIGRQTRAGWLNVMLRRGQSQPEAELSFEVSEPGSTVEQLLSVEVPPLDPGDYVLTVTVEDLLGQRSATRREPFRVVERDER